MRKTFRVVQTANRLVLVVLLLCSLTTMVRAQVDTLRKDTAPPQADTTTVSTENIQANLTKVDTTAPAVYKINPVSTILIGVAATGANMIAINNVLHNKPELSVAEIQAANRNMISRNCISTNMRYGSTTVGDMKCSTQAIIHRRGMEQ